MPKKSRPKPLRKSRWVGDRLDWVQYPDSPIDPDYVPRRGDETSSSPDKGDLTAVGSSLVPVQSARVDEKPDSPSDYSVGSLTPSTHLSLSPTNAQPDSLRAKRHWTVAAFGRERVTAHGVEKETRWTSKDIPVSLLHIDEEGQYFETNDGIRHYITAQGDPFLNTDGRRVCKVDFRKTWVREDDVDPPQIIGSSSPQRSGPDDHHEVPSSPPRNPGDKKGASVTTSPTSRVGRSPPLPGDKKCRPVRKQRPSTPIAAPRVAPRHTSRGDMVDLLGHPSSASTNYDREIASAIDAGLLSGVIGTTTGVCPSIIRKHKAKPSVRPVKFTQKVVDRPSHQVNFRRHANAAAFYAHRSGHDVAKACHRCSEGHGVFQACVVADDFSMGACTNCAYGGNTTKDCSFRTDTRHPWGHSPARRLPRPSSRATGSTAKTIARRHGSPALAATSPTSAATVPTSDDYDFVFTSSSRVSSATSASQGDYLMRCALGSPDHEQSRSQDNSLTAKRVVSATSASRGESLLSGALGSPDDHEPQSQDSSPKAKRASSGKHPKRKRSRASTPRPDAYRALSVEILHVSSIHREAHPSPRKALPAEITTWLARQGKPLTRSIVHVGSHFDPGDLTEEQFWYVVDCCDVSNQEFLRNQYQWHKYDMRQQGTVYDRSFWEHFAWEDCKWFRDQVVSIVCPRK